MLSLASGRLRPDSTGEFPNGTSGAGLAALNDGFDLLQADMIPQAGRPSQSSPEQGLFGSGWNSRPVRFAWASSALRESLFTFRRLWLQSIARQGFREQE